MLDSWVSKYGTDLFLYPDLALDEPQAPIDKHELALIYSPRLQDDLVDYYRKHMLVTRLSMRQRNSRGTTRRSSPNKTKAHKAMIGGQQEANPQTQGTFIATSLPSIHTTSNTVHHLSDEAVFKNYTFPDIEMMSCAYLRKIDSDVLRAQRDRQPEQARQQRAKVPKKPRGGFFSTVSSWLPFLGPGEDEPSQGSTKSKAGNEKLLFEEKGKGATCILQKNLKDNMDDGGPWKTDAVMHMKGPGGHPDDSLHRLDPHGCAPSSLYATHRPYMATY